MKPTLNAFAQNLSYTNWRNPNFTAFSPSRIKIEVLAGLTVSLALVPEAVAFAFVAGVHPLVGLYAAFIVGLITALIGGRPGMVSGATGALAVVMVELVAHHGVEYLFATVVLMGLLQIMAGVCHLGKFIRLVPHPVMLGFVNGLAIVIFLAQLSQFKVGPEGAKMWMEMGPMTIMLGACWSDNGDYMVNAKADPYYPSTSRRHRYRCGYRHWVWHRCAPCWRSCLY